MASIDIREYPSDGIDEIRFADENEVVYNASKLLKEKLDGSSVITLADNAYRMRLSVITKTDAENLIKALQKAIEIG